MLRTKDVDMVPQADLTTRVVRELLRSHAHSAGDIGVVTPYSAQVSYCSYQALRRLFSDVGVFLSNLFASPLIFPASILVHTFVSYHIFKIFMMICR